MNRLFPRAGLALALLLPAAAGAQSAEYRRSPADTLRYHEVSGSTAELTTPNGVIPIRNRHDARVAVTFGAGDTARAWFEALSIGATSPDGERAPDTAPLLHRPYVLRFDARGRTETLAVPAIPATFEGVTDLTHEFNDFFVALPTTPLRVGATWTDTVRKEMTNARGRTLKTTRIGRYTVRRDSTVAGVRVLVVDARMQNRLEAAGPAGQGSPLQVSSVQEGTEEGTFYFAPETGRMVGRRRAGTLAGAITFTGGPQPVTFQQTHRYESRIDLVAGP